jgi:hypothetical protein
VGQEAVRLQHRGNTLPIKSTNLQNFLFSRGVKSTRKNWVWEVGGIKDGVRECFAPCQPVLRRAVKGRLYILAQCEGRLEFPDPWEGQDLSKLGLTSIFLSFCGTGV